MGCEHVVSCEPNFDPVLEEQRAALEEQRVNQVKFVLCSGHLSNCTQNMCVGADACGRCRNGVR